MDFPTRIPSTEPDTLGDGQQVHVKVTDHHSQCVRELNRGNRKETLKEEADTNADGEERRNPGRSDKHRHVTITGTEASKRKARSSGRTKPNRTSTTEDSSSTATEDEGVRVKKPRGPSHSQYGASETRNPSSKKTSKKQSQGKITTKSKGASQQQRKPQTATKHQETDPKDDVRVLSGSEEDQRILGFDKDESKGVAIKTYKRWRSLLGEERTSDSRAGADLKYDKILKVHHMYEGHGGADKLCAS
jgi:hypothetical protein